MEFIPHSQAPSSKRDTGHAAYILSEMARDPSRAQTLRSLQDEARRLFAETVDRIVGKLAQDMPFASMQVSDALSGAVLARASRRVSMNTIERRELARMLLAGALLNRNNPAWNPADPSTDRADHDDPLVALLQLDLQAPR